MMSQQVKRYIGGLLACLIMWAGVQTVQGQIWKRYRNLEGVWKFSIGDHSDWKSPDFDDKSWDNIHVPASWEQQGYERYNGYAWYRKNIEMTVVPGRVIYLHLGAVDDADEVYLNGRFVDRSGSFPPHTQTAWNRKRIYAIPYSYWQEGKNVLAVKVYDFYNEGGIINGPVALYVDEMNQYLSVNLSGRWNFTTHNHSINEKVHPSSAKWTTIEVPGYWESQGWSYYDGVAWYHRTFECNSQLEGQELFLVLGRIDDQEIVFLNNQRIGDTKTLQQGRSYWNREDDYRVFRAYKIPSGAIRFDETNSITIKVNDLMGDGGIYEGPVGIMTRKQLEKYYQWRQSEDSGLNNFLKWLLD